MDHVSAVSSTLSNPKMTGKKRMKRIHVLRKKPQFIASQVGARFIAPMGWSGVWLFLLKKMHLQAIAE